MESVTEDLFRSDADFFEPPQMKFLALRRLFGYFAIRACDMGLYCSPWMVWSLYGILATLFLCIAPFYTSSDIVAEGLIHVLLDFGTLLTLTLISSCAPFVDGLLFSAAIVKHHDTSRLQRHLFLSPPRGTIILRDPPSCRGRVDLRPCLVGFCLLTSLTVHAHTTVIPLDLLRLCNLFLTSAIVLSDGPSYKC